METKTVWTLGPEEIIARLEGQVNLMRKICDAIRYEITLVEDDHFLFLQDNPKYNKRIQDLKEILDRLHN